METGVAEPSSDTAKQDMADGQAAAEAAERKPRGDKVLGDGRPAPTKKKQIHQPMVDPLPTTTWEAERHGPAPRRPA